MINLEMELESFLPINLSRILKISPDICETTRTSINLYNKARDCMLLGSEDIAIIELKKAISHNPEFCEAYNLLGLAYYGSCEYEKASKMFESVLKMENDNIKALEYLSIIRSNKEYHKNEDKKLMIKNIAHSTVNTKKKKNS